MNELKVNCVIGIDPGAAGGMAVYVAGEPTIRVARMPKQLEDLREFFAYYAENYAPIVFLEKLTVRPDDVKVDDGGASLGKLYRIQRMLAGYEKIKAYLETAGIPYILIHPLSWQTRLGLRQKGIQESKSERKHRYQGFAGKLYPATRMTLWNADAVLIMHFGRVVLANDLKWVRANLPSREHDKLF